MANPRKRKLVKTGEIEKIINSENKNKKEQDLKNDTEQTKTVEKDNDKPMDSFIAKELEEIERIPSNKKKTTTKKKTTLKKKTGGK